MADSIFACVTSMGFCAKFWGICHWVAFDFFPFLSCLKIVGLKSQHLRTGLHSKGPTRERNVRFLPDLLYNFFFPLLIISNTDTCLERIFPLRWNLVALCQGWRRVLNSATATAATGKKILPPPFSSTESWMREADASDELQSVQR